MNLKSDHQRHFSDGIDNSDGRDEMFAAECLFSAQLNKHFVKDNSLYFRGILVIQRRN